jgi:hypothetical protein
VISLLEKEEINVNWPNPQDGNVYLAPSSMNRTSATAYSVFLFSCL